MHQINLFEILNLSNLNCRYKLLAVSNLPRDDAYGKNVNLLAKKIAYELEQPVALLFGDKQTRLAIPASSKLPNLEQPLTPHVAMLIPLEEIRILDFKKLDAKTLPIAKSFLRSAFQRPLMKNPKLWGNGRCYFWKRPLRVDGEIDIFEGFIFNIVLLEDERLCVSLDITHKYVDKSWFLDRVDERDIARYRMRHFLKNPPYWIRNLDKDSPTIIYRYPGSEKQRYGAAALCKLMCSTKEPMVSKLHRNTILSPQKRFQKIEGVVRKNRRKCVNPQLASWFPVNDKEGIVCNTGKPFRFQGTVNPLHVVIVEGELVIDCVLEDTFALSQLIFSAPLRCGRLPATIRLADDFLEPIASKVELDEAMYDDTEDEFEEDFEVKEIMKIEGG